ncbi:glycosyltransferase family 4 protein [Sphaerisporangium perillae]|uniref:glycosyltransferase family 4 protein n=1 Tax=Sphaerisporangium perillae TaxID=2935860 RepID=UPI00200D3D75|nr:glycosyltransferase family 4 protein [Sphaerisporangium perillae]
MGLQRIVLTWVATGRGGAERSIEEVAEYLARFGMDVAVVWWRHGDGPAYLGTRPGVDVRQVADLAGYRAQLAAVMGDGHGTVLVSTQRTVLVDLHHAGAAPVLAVVHGIIQPDHPLRVIDPNSGGLVEYPPGSWPWDRLHRVARWVGISEASAASIRQAAPPGTPVEVILNGLTVPAVHPERAPRGPVLRVAAVARAVPWKRLDHIIAALAHPLLTGRSRLDVYGAEDSAHLQRLADELGVPFTCHGYVDELSEHLSRADVLAGAVLVEGFGRCVVDAAGGGTPSVMPNAGACPEVVLDGITGLLYDPADPDGLAHALYWAAETDPGELAAMGQAARHRALAWFTPGRCATEYLHLAYEVSNQARALVGAGA